MRALNEIIVHCSATPEGRNFTVRQIRSWHRERGWSDIGYHYVIYLDGSVHVGRPLSKAGAHVRGRNTGTIGVCYVGGVASNGRTPKDTRTAAQKAALTFLMSELVQKYPSIRKISGHRDYANKACPSFDATREYANLIAFARKGGTAGEKQADEDLIGDVYRVSARVANFRAGPGEHVKGSLPRGTPVTATGDIAGNWMEVKSPAGYVGWMHESVLTEMDLA